VLLICICIHLRRFSLLPPRIALVLNQRLDPFSIFGDGIFSLVSIFARNPRQGLWA
jgi:hypothetical protein